LLLKFSQPALTLCATEAAPAGRALQTIIIADRVRKFLFMRINKVPFKARLMAVNAKCNGGDSVIQTDNFS